MDKTLISINGRGGSGKSTIGRLLTHELDSAAFFDFDFVTVVNPWEYGEELFRLGHVNSADLIQFPAKQ